MSLLDQIDHARRGGRAFHFEVQEAGRPIPSVPLSEHRIVVQTDKQKASKVTVIVPLYNYAQYVEEALIPWWHRASPMST